MLNRPTTSLHMRIALQAKVVISNSGHFATDSTVESGGSLEHMGGFH